MTVAEMPPYHELLLSVLRAVSEPGGSASISEISETVILRKGFSEAQQAVLHHDGPGTEIRYRLAWAPGPGTLAAFATSGQAMVREAVFDLAQVSGFPASLE